MHLRTLHWIYPTNHLFRGFFCLRRNPQHQPCHSGPFSNSKGVFRSFIFRNRGQLAFCQLCTPEGCVVLVFVHFISFHTAWSLPIHYHKIPWKRGKDIFRNLNNFLQDSFSLPHPLPLYIHVFLPSHMHLSLTNPASLFSLSFSNTAVSKNCCVQEQWSRILPIYCSPHPLFSSFLTQLCKHCSVHSACSFKSEETLGRRGQQLTNQKGETAASE